jgi:aminoglycoside phosphotransferase (APT) family kinase protein
VTQTNTSTPAPIDDGREHFARREITDVLGRYDTGTITSVREMIAGSSIAPKAVIECGRGKLLLKRRAPGLEHAPLVGFAHSVILGLLERSICVPPLIGTRGDNNSMCQIADKTYELFVFIEGTPYARTEAQAYSTGQLLAQMHGAMDTIETRFDAPREPKPVNPERVGGAGLSDRDAHDATRMLTYAIEAHHANARPPALVHGDWHPGNMIYDGDEIIGACDFDNTRIGSRDRELAQALVYFSMKRASETDRPDDPMMDLLTSVWRGYRDTSGTTPNPRLCASMLPAVLIDEALADTGIDHESRATLVRLALQKARVLDEKMGEIEGVLSRA